MTLREESRTTQSAQFFSIIGWTEAELPEGYRDDLRCYNFTLERDGKHYQMRAFVDTYRLNGVTRTMVSFVEMHYDDTQGFREVCRSREKEERYHELILQVREQLGLPRPMPRGSDEDAPVRRNGLPNTDTVGPTMSLIPGEPDCQHPAQVTGEEEEDAPVQAAQAERLVLA